MKFWKFCTYRREIVEARRGEDCRTRALGSAGSGRVRPGRLILRHCAVVRPRSAGSVNAPSQRQRRFLPSFATLPSEGWEKDPLVRRTAVGSGRRLASVLPFSVTPGYSQLLPALPSAVFRWWFWSCRAPQGWSERRPSTGGTTPLACHGSTTEDSPYEACRRLPHPTSSSPHHHLLARP